MTNVGKKTGKGKRKIKAGRSTIFLKKEVNEKPVTFP